MVLTMATLLVTARQYIGDPIDCMVEVNILRINYARLIELNINTNAFMSDEWCVCVTVTSSTLKGIPNGIMDTYCWIHSTFSIPERFNDKHS